MVYVSKKAQVFNLKLSEKTDKLESKRNVRELRIT